MDGTMCKDKACIFKKSCYRYLATPNPYRQSYFMNSPFNDEELDCDNRWEVVVIDFFDTKGIKKVTSDNQ